MVSKKLESLLMKIAYIIIFQKTDLSFALAQRFKKKLFLMKLNKVKFI